MSSFTRLAEGRTCLLKSFLLWLRCPGHTNCGVIAEICVCSLSLIIVTTRALKFHDCKLLLRWHILESKKTKTKMNAASGLFLLLWLSDKAHTVKTLFPLPFADGIKICRFFHWHWVLCSLLLHKAEKQILFQLATSSELVLICIWMLSSTSALNTTCTAYSRDIAADALRVCSIDHNQ